MRPGSNTYGKFHEGKASSPWLSDAEPVLFSHQFQPWEGWVASPDANRGPKLELGSDQGGCGVAVEQFSVTDVAGEHGV